MEPKEKITEFIQAILRKRNDTLPLDSQMPLLSIGRIDSVDVVAIVVFLEENFGVDFSERGIKPKDFENIDKMASLLERSAS